MSNAPISSTMVENRRFAPSEAFAKDAHVKSLEAYQALYKRAEDDPDGYWAEQAQALRWLKPWKQVLDWQPPFAKWFVGGELNVSDNCLDRHLAAQGSVPSRADKPAIIFEGEPGDRRTISYKQLHEEVSRLANGLKKLGVGAGDRVAIYLPMIPEAAVAMLACSRIGATHTVIFGGFSSDALRDRVNDAGCKIIITADGGWRRGAIVPLKPQVDAARAQTPSVTHVIVVKRTKQPVEAQAGDVDYHELLQSVSAECPPTPLESSHPLFILYTSGTTGKPKGVVHATGGYLVNAALTTKWVFDLKEKDVFFCTADVGWVTGHSYVVYGPLANGATVVMYEGAPNFPEPDRLWEIIDRHKVTIFYTAPTAIRSFIRWGDQWPNKHKLNTLRLLGSVGEPINPEAWMWYQRVIGKEHCPIVDTWWQTETGGIMCSPLPGATPTKPGSCTLPLPGVALDVVDKTGKSVAANEGGILVIKRPWPSMLTTLFNDNERYRKAYFGETFSSLGAEASKAIYVAGDGARRDADGYYWVMGRIDDVVNVSGHRLGTAEVESALVSHSKVAEAAVVGRNDELKGQALVAFVTLKQGVPSSDELKTDLKNHVAKEIGSIAKPDEIRFADALPKTRSGKIMRRLLRELASGEKVKGDTSTLEDFSTLEKLRQDDE